MNETTGWRIVTLSAIFMIGALILASVWYQHLDRENWLREELRHMKSELGMQIRAQFDVRSRPAIP
jgi:hypothetical protein